MQLPIFNNCLNIYLFVTYSIITIIYLMIRVIVEVRSYIYPSTIQIFTENENISHQLNFIFEETQRFPFKKLLKVP